MESSEINCSFFIKKQNVEFSSWSFANHLALSVLFGHSLHFSGISVEVKYIFSNGEKQKQEHPDKWHPKRSSHFGMPKMETFE